MQRMFGNHFKLGLTKISWKLAKEQDTEQGTLKVWDIHRKTKKHASFLIYWSFVAKYDVILVT